eukprot:TRINITY_DN7527_c0_g1_i4.p1 TRINITY_DN7527_c0_g1~~TRINITY_DN7527_c0_g1_i4.p1  ORF type:complete len:121 (+),score=28.57 TRINITY_DN7527_c0_g1_i4:2-364(+)
MPSDETWSTCYMSFFNAKVHQIHRKLAKKIEEDLDDNNDLNLGRGNGPFFQHRLALSPPASVLLYLSVQDFSSPKCNQSNLQSHRTATPLRPPSLKRKSLSSAAFLFCRFFTSFLTCKVS